MYGSPGSVPIFRFFVEKKTNYKTTGLNCLDSDYNNQGAHLYARGRVYRSFCSAQDTRKMFKQTLWYSHISTVMFLLLKACVMTSVFALVESEQHERDGVGGRTRFQRYFEDADLPP